jgi:hypothetical protein
MARMIGASLPQGERKPKTGTLVSVSTRITSLAGGGALFAPSEHGDFGLDLDRPERTKPVPLNSGPCLLQRIRRQRHSADEILHAHDEHCRLATLIDNEGLIVADDEFHDMVELGAGDVGIDTAVHDSCDSN